MKSVRLSASCSGQCTMRRTPGSPHTTAPSPTCPKMACCSPIAATSSVVASSRDDTPSRRAKSSTSDNAAAKPCRIHSFASSAFLSNSAFVFKCKIAAVQAARDPRCDSNAEPAPSATAMSKNLARSSATTKSTKCESWHGSESARWLVPRAAACATRQGRIGQVGMSAQPLSPVGGGNAVCVPTCDCETRVCELESQRNNSRKAMPFNRSGCREGDSWRSLS